MSGAGAVRAVSAVRSPGGAGSRVKHENDGGGQLAPARGERRLCLFRLFPNPV